MKTLAVLLLTIVAFSAFGGSAKSKQLYTYTGNDLSTNCVDGSAYRRGLCLGYVNGVASMQKKACIPDGVKFGQLKRVVERYMEENPEQTHKHAFKIVVAALKEAWPCK